LFGCDLTFSQNRLNAGSNGGTLKYRSSSENAAVSHCAVIAAKSAPAPAFCDDVGKRSTGPKRVVRKQQPPQQQLRVPLRAAAQIAKS
jgi:hypothetical protein